MSNAMGSSKLVFGTGGRFGRLSTKLAQSLVDKAVEGGIRSFDTGLFYCHGKSQPLLFACLADHVNKAPTSFQISTKIPAGYSHAVMREWITTSIAQLGTRDYIDTLFLWGPSQIHLYDSRLVSSLLLLKSSGLVQSIGVNTHDYEVMAALLESPVGSIVDSVMVDFNLLQQDRLPLLYLYARAGVSVWAGTALCQGFLTQSLMQMTFRSRSLSYLARAIFNRPTRQLRLKASTVRPLLIKYFPDCYQSIPLSYVLSHDIVAKVPIGMLSSSSIAQNLLIESSIVDNSILSEAADLVSRCSGIPQQ